MVGVDVQRVQVAFVNAVVLLQLRIQPGDCVEVQPLFRVIERLAQEQVPGRLRFGIVCCQDPGHRQQAEQQDSTTYHELPVCEVDSVVVTKQGDLDQTRAFLLGEGVTGGFPVFVVP